MPQTQLPAHLRKFVVDQSTTRYTSVEQATWRYILRQLKSYFSEHAHPCYLRGLKAAGITEDSIPQVSHISECLSKFGWQAIPVSGFIPPAAFMEMQALGFLPIAKDMRSLEHLSYTPAPDIVHEAAGHAPILIDPEFSEYLRRYAQVAKKAILNSEDLEIYDAIRELSDIKESPRATKGQIQRAEERLENANKISGPPSEGALLARMNWWTAEYGLIGSIENPKVFGAGLLSSVAEGKACLSPKVQKIPFSLDCIHYSYDITEPQPQLFVTPHFEALTLVVEEMAKQMAYSLGGPTSLDKAIVSKCANTVEFENGLQIGGVLERYELYQGRLSFLKWIGPTQLCIKDIEIAGQGITRHKDGFSCPAGAIEGFEKYPATMTKEELDAKNFKAGSIAKLKYVSGVRLNGKIKHVEYRNGLPLYATLLDCTIEQGSQKLFDPSWGEFDLVFVNEAKSVYAGVPDRLAYGETQGFSVRKVEPPPQSEESQALDQIYGELRKAREGASLGPAFLHQIEGIHERLSRQFPKEWLARLEIIEISHRNPGLSQLESTVRDEIKKIQSQNLDLQVPIAEGLAIVGSQ
ncbi:MAG: phenylalanine 4-monooxygenase [Bdellovibrionales bacterium CG10_big_fil_rev_8_21_14_0_10_45_34]|nr:MAG: phenylalanine 4-monooxygenase [Bdellovibrionales bacterium CG10_big_fil_rev_8_21_14_0_10_45_34]